MFRFAITNLTNDYIVWTGTEVTTTVIEALVEQGISTSDMGIDIEEVDNIPTPHLVEEFPNDWITDGWSRGPGGRWIELGHSAGVTIGGGVEIPPQLSIHGVADKLNELEGKL